VSQPLSSSDEDDSLKVFAYILPQNAYWERADTKEAFSAMEKEVKLKCRVK
jgi:hypothetical protein